MFLRHFLRLLLAALLIATSLSGEEQNGWPFSVRQLKSDGTADSSEYLGPLIFARTRPDGADVRGFRPFYLHTTEGARETKNWLYPFFTWQKEGDYRYFTFFELINFRRQPEIGPAGGSVRGFDVWPFYFSRQSADPASSYQALFPLGGTIKQRFGKDRIHFILFPLYANVEKSGSRTIHAPWPLLRFISGAGKHGFEFWPLFGHQGREGDYDSRFYLWPLIYRSAKNLSEPVPDVHLGFLPFYSRDTAPGYRNENFIWPFFGYTERTVPAHYHERRYLWPLLVQGRGEVSYVNRWAPVFTHSVIKGYDKTWVGWPIYRHAEWNDGNGVAQEKNQVLYFLYWSLTQHSLTNPSAAPAHKTHLWPLFSSWDNGNGRRQLQLFSPFEVFFPTNEPIRQLYSPLVAIYRYDQRAPDDARLSLLFNLITWKKSPVEKEFHLGPLLGVHATSEKSRVAFGGGLLAWQRPAPGAAWKFSLFDFHRTSDKTNSAGTSP